MKKLITLAAVFLVLLHASANAQHNYLSIEEIREQTPDHWTQSYETQWRTIEINAPVYVPEVNEFPIIRVVRAPAVDTALLVEDCDVRMNVSGILSVDFGKSRLVLSGQEEHRETIVFSNGEIPAIIAEGSTISAEQATDILLNRIQQMTGHDNSDFRIKSLTIYGPVWKYRLDGDEKIYTESVTTSGNYMIELEQLFHGIPYRACGECSGRLTRDNQWLPHASVAGNVQTENRFTLTANLFCETDMPYHDVPILSFSEAKSAIEKEIFAGHLRTVDAIELAYVPYLDPSEEGIFWLLPVWVAKGGYTRDANREFISLDEENLPRSEVVFEAQNGTLMDYSEGGSSRQVPEIITWDDVKR